MSKNAHTPGPWNNFKSVIICNQDDAGLQISFVNTSCADRRAEGRANAFLITAAPDLLEALEGLLENERQSSFEYWLSVKHPSGDCDAVHSQWLESSEYHDFLDLYESEIASVAKARGEA